VSGRQLESLLARIYTCAGDLERFLAHPEATALEAGCTPAEAASLLPVDEAGLRMAFQSFERKRSGRMYPPKSSVP
jgi:hypothetical protein